MRQRLLLRTAIVAAGIAVISGCHPVGLSDSSETDTVVTVKAHAYDYTKNRTYDMPDTVADLCGKDINPPPRDAGAGGEGGQSGGTPVSDLVDCEAITHTFDPLILDTVRKNLESLGYVHVAADATEPPDVVMLVGALAANNWFAYTAYPWYWYYPGYGYWYDYYYGWNAYYPYYPVTAVVNYPTGTLLMNLVSLKDADATDHRIPSIWLGSINGLLSSGDVGATDRITTNIDQAFMQSSYLHAGKE
jgi:hypothetical protein